LADDASKLLLQGHRARFKARIGKFFRPGGRLGDGRRQRYAQHDQGGEQAAK
jgi:hypothetical protein